MKKQKVFRHGDVNFHAIEINLPKDGLVKHNGSFVFALGETTGHKHVLTVDKKEDLKIYDTERGRIYFLASTAKLSHEEHETIELPKGVYIQVQELEYDWFQNTPRKVID